MAHGAGSKGLQERGAGTTLDGKPKTPAAYFVIFRRLFLLGLLLPAPAFAQGDDRSTENMYLSGTEVRPTGPVMGDLVAAAGRITIDHYVQGDAVLAAGSIDLRGSIGDDLRAAG